MVRERLVMFWIGRVRRRGKGALCWFGFFVLQEEYLKFVMVPMESCLSYWVEKMPEDSLGMLLSHPNVCVLACYLCAAFLGVTEEEMHPSSVACGTSALQFRSASCVNFLLSHFLQGCLLYLTFI